MEQTYEVIDEYVIEDFKCSVYKTYALMSGAHLAYSHINSSEAEKNMFTEIHNELIRGI
jgi:hypothetical protein